MQILVHNQQRHYFFLTRVYENNLHSAAEKLQCWEITSCLATCAEFPGQRPWLWCPLVSRCAMLPSGGQAQSRDDNHPTVTPLHARSPARVVSQFSCFVVTKMWHFCAFFCAFRWTFNLWRDIAKNKGIRVTERKHKPKVGCLGTMTKYYQLNKAKK